MKSDESLILASSSSYRRTLLERLALPFGTVASDVDEGAVPGEKPQERATRLALAKSRAVADRRPDAWVIGSDQVAVCGTQVLDKPMSRLRCAEQLRASSGQRVEFLTAVALTRADRNFERQALDRTFVQFRLLHEDEITRYIDAEQPFDCAGGFKCEGLGIALFDSIESTDPTGLIGLPLIAVCSLLRSAGFCIP